MGTDKKPRPAYMVDVDEISGKQIRGTVISATQEKEKEKPKLSQRESRSKPSRKSQSDTGNYSTEKNIGQGPVVESMTEKEVKLERRKSTSASLKSPRKSSGRPPSAHENRAFTKNSQPKPHREDPSHYGIPTTTYGPAVVSHPPAPVNIPIRPRALTQAQTFPRPSSYYQTQTSTGGYGPPLSTSAYYTQPPAIITPSPSYPPPSPSSSFLQYAMTQQPIPTHGDYFSPHLTAPMARPLSSRFDSIPRSAQALDPITRTASAWGPREPRRLHADDQYDEMYYEDSYASRVSDGAVRRRENIRGPSVRIQVDPDYIAMPPPPRPILRRPATEHPAARKEDRSEYREREVRPRYRDEASPHRPSANRNSVSYDLGKDSERVRIEPAGKNRRRQSYYGQTASTVSSGYEDKLNQAANYQEDIGGPSIPLTAEVLRRQQKRQGGSSRSTKSSGSRDESDYRKSATTRTTRSGSGNDDENVTIKVTGQARVMVGGAQIDCNDGGEIRIERQSRIRNGSERSSSDFGGQRQIDDRHSRIDRPTARTRLNSRDSYLRAPPQFDNYI